MVRIGSSGPVGLMMNQNSMLTMLTSQTALGAEVSHLGEEDNQTIHHVEIETVTKHELPEVAGLRLVGAVRPPDCQNQLSETMIEFRRISVDTIAELTEAV